jgi:hypothetical protein
MALRCYCAETERTPRSCRGLQSPGRDPIEAATTPEASLPRLRGRRLDRPTALFRPGIRADGLPHKVLGDHTRPPTPKEPQRRSRRYGPATGPAQPGRSTSRNAQEWRATETVLLHHRGMAQPYGPPGRRWCRLPVLLPHDLANKVQLGRSGTFQSTVHTYQSPSHDRPKLHQVCRQTGRDSPKRAMTPKTSPPVSGVRPGPGGDPSAAVGRDSPGWLDGEPPVPTANPSTPPAGAAGRGPA